MKKYIIGFFALVLLSLSAPYYCMAEGAIEKNFLFPDTYIPNNTEGNFSAFQSRPWDPKEKDIILNAIKEIGKRQPGLIRRLTACRPYSIYRIDKTMIDAWSVQSENAFVVSDGFFARGPGLVIAHEMVHPIDSALQLSYSKEWLAIYNPIMEKIAARLKQEGMSVIEAVWIKRVNRENVAHEEGLPTLYAATDAQEGLAECVSQTLFGDGSAIAKPIQKYLQSKVFSAGFRPTESQRHYHQGLAYFVHSGLNDAAKEFDLAVKKDPGFVFAYLRRAEVEIALGDYNKAAGDYSRAIGLLDTTNLPRLYLERGAVWVKLKDWKQAIADFSAGIKIRPEITSAYVDRGKAYFEADQYDAAIADFDVYINKNPGNSGGYLERAKARRAKRDLDGAIADASESLRLQPDNWFGYYLRGMCYGAKPDFLNAKKDLEEALRLNPGAKDTLEPLIKIAEGGLSQPKQ